MAQEIADVQKLIRASGLKHTMHSAGTTVGKSEHLSAYSEPAGHPTRDLSAIDDR